MRIDYFRGGLDSFGMSLEHLKKNTDRDLRASILLGFHGIFCLFKAIGSKHGIRISRGRRSVNFPTLVGALMRLGWLRSAERRSLELLNRLRNATEHSEVEYDAERFKAALFGVLPILERIVREYNDTDLQDLISGESWEILIEIQEFFSHRIRVLDEIVEEAVGEPKSKDELWEPRESVWCENCSTLGLPWRGEEKIKCRLCGELSLIEICQICNGPVSVSEDSEWPYFHSECFQSLK